MLCIEDWVAPVWPPPRGGYALHRRLGLIKPILSYMLFLGVHIRLGLIKPPPRLGGPLLFFLVALLHPYKTGAPLCKGPPSLLCRAYPPLYMIYAAERHANLALLSLKGPPPLKRVAGGVPLKGGRPYNRRLVAPI
jgi:hypothetical protein